jgi:hypothetical protein
MGYAAQMSTRPQTIGYALTDSLAGLAAWIVEKLWAWSDNDGRLEDAISLRDVLDLLSLYWLTATPASAARMYWESFPKPAPTSGAAREPAPITVPTGGMVMPADHGRPSRRWAARRYPDLRRWTELERGGHFPAIEVPRGLRPGAARLLRPRPLPPSDPRLPRRAGALPAPRAFSR